MIKKAQNIKRLELSAELVMNLIADKLNLKKQEDDSKSKYEIVATGADPKACTVIIYMKTDENSIIAEGAYCPEISLQDIFGNDNMWLSVIKDKEKDNEKEE